MRKKKQFGVQEFRSLEVTRSLNITPGEISSVIEEKNSVAVY